MASVRQCTRTATALAVTSIRQCTRTVGAPAVISTGQEARPCRQCLTEGKSGRGGGQSSCRLSRVRRACHGAESARPDFPRLTSLGNPRQTDLPSSTPTPILRFHPHNKFHLTSEKNGLFLSSSFFFFFLQSAMREVWAVRAHVGLLNAESCLTKQTTYATLVTGKGK